MKRIDIVMAQSENTTRASLISGYCPHHFIKGIGTIESDCEEINCTTCWNRDDGYNLEIKFAVPPSDENINEGVGVVDDYAEIRIEALKAEVLDYLKSQLEVLEDWKYFECPPEIRKQVTTLKIVLGDITKIFEKY